MKRARIGWVVVTALALLVLALPACEPKGSPATTAKAAPGAKPAVKVSDEPMKPEEVAAASGGAAPAAPAGAPAPAAPAAPVAPGTVTAQAVLQPARETPGFSGTVTFTATGGEVHVVADVAGVTPPGNHGFHVHENGKCERDPAGKDFTTAGGHFNPAGAPHACPDAASHHAGDLGNIVIQADGRGHLDVTTSALSLSGATSVIGRSLILHSAADDCTTQPTGNAGGRLACGVITVVGGTAPGAAGGASGH
jgi:Cu-Zn family superoxide dismutase